MRSSRPEGDTRLCQFQSGFVDTYLDETLEVHAAECYSQSEPAYPSNSVPSNSLVPQGQCGEKGAYTIPIQKDIMFGWDASNAIQNIGMESGS